MTSLIAYILRRLREEHELRGRREPGVYWVTDLIYCPLKRQLALKYPELAEPRYDPWLVFGRIVHEGLEYLLLQQYIDSPDAEVLLEQEFKRVIQGPEVEVEVVGRPDAVVRINGHIDTLYEFKTGFPGQQLPHDHHLLQVRLYLWLTGAPVGWLVYVMPDRITEYQVVKRVSEDEVVALLLDDKTPRWDWECKKCPYRAYCPKYGQKDEGSKQARLG